MPLIDFNVEHSRMLHRIKHPEYGKMADPNDTEERDARRMEIELEESLRKALEENAEDGDTLSE